MADRFTERYRQAQSPVMLEIERAVLGCGYGATSWTTKDEAEKVCAMLALRPGKHLLEIGAGSGWPALYLASLSGCDVTLTDLPVNGLRAALDRAERDRSGGTTWAIAADGAALPFGDGCFDAISHSDVLCCLQAKLRMLQACRGAIRADGRTVFTVISLAPDLAAADYEFIKRSGAPPFVDTDEDYPALLRRSGWTIEEHIDLTRDFLDASSRTLREEEARRNELTALLGGTALAEKLTRRRARIDALEKGWLKRSLFSVSPADSA
jgi:SAM-dependent methyltransferase